MKKASSAESSEGATEVSAWDTQVGAFAEAVHKSLEDINKALVPLVGEPSDDALLILNDPQILSEEDLKTALVVSDQSPKIPLGVFRQNLPKLRKISITSGSEREDRRVSFDILPSVPDAAGFLELLKVGGDLRVGKTEIISAVKAAIASKLSLYDMPNALLMQMEKHAEEQSQPVGKTFFELQKLVTSRAYGDVLSVLGVSGNFVSEKRKRVLLERVNTKLWGSLQSFNDLLDAWQKSWMQTAGNPAVLLASIAMGQQGGVGSVIPPGMNQPPDTSALRDAVDGVVDEINMIFAGAGIPVARALAYDASRISKLIEDESLPAATGYANREQMLRGLGLAVTSDYVRMERNVARYALALIELPQVPSGNEEYAYLGAMLQLGAIIPWNKLLE